MYKRLSAILFPIITLAFIGAAVWGYQENQEKNAVLIKAENQYQRAFHDLSYHMDQLNSEIGKTIALNSDSKDYYRKGLVNVWRITNQAQNEINQLPLTLLPFNKTEEFLANISNFSYRTAVRDLTKNPMKDGEKQTLLALYKRSKEINQELQNVQSKVLSHNLRWMDVENALASQKQQQDNTIIDGFKMVDKKVSGYSDIQWGPTDAALYEKRNVKALSGNFITEEDAKRKTVQFLGLPNSASLQAARNGAGTEMASISVKGKMPLTGQPLHMEFTQKGGFLVSFMAPRNVSEKVIDQQGAQEAASDFLQRHGYPNMKPVNYDEYDSMAAITYARQDGNVTIYPEKIVVNVALDNADVTGMLASDYVFEHKDRPSTKPALTPEEAKKHLNDGFKTQAQSLALIKNDEKQNVLCYEFIGRINGAGYRVYINTDTGVEEKIEQFPSPDQANR